MKIITERIIFIGKAKLSSYRRIDSNIEIQEMYELEDSSQAVAKFIDEIEKFKVFSLPKGIERNHAGFISQTFSSKRHKYKDHIRYYVLVNTIMRVNEWTSPKVEDEFIPYEILH